jgi:arginine-tRNA-protein transferase
MKVFYSEYLKNYSTYTFGYAVYAICEPEDKLSDFYIKGFLPYAGESEYSSDRETREIYYLTRGLRINLANFVVSSEIRRIARKAEPFQVNFELFDKSHFLHDSHFNKFCTQYAAERFKGGHMNEKRWSYLLKRNCGTHIFSFQIERQIVGYVLAGIDEKSVHYWFSFFDTNYLEHFPIGKYMMASIIQWAQENEKTHVYLGTCYGPHSLYKARDFKGAEFFDGSGWNPDIAVLKTWCKSEDAEMLSDRYKNSF